MAILCRRKQDNSPVVIKELFTQCMTEDEKQTSLNEIKVLTILRHPNIIAYFDSFTAMGIMDAESLSSSGASSGGNGHLGDIDPNMPKQPVRKSSDRKKVVLSEPASHSSRKGKIPSTLMIVMEYADGGTLSDYLESLQESGTRMEIHVGYEEARYHCYALLSSRLEIMNLFCQIGLALNHIHSLNILHRDLKTNNILVSGCGRYKVLKIGDFGISKIMSTAASAETVVGTPAYISPELCEGKPYNEKSDIWALGCVLYEMICLKKMFSAHNLPALVLRILRGTYEPIPVHVPSNLAVLVKSCVETEPEKRPFMPDIIGMPFLQDALVQTIFGVGRIDHPRLVQTPLDTALAAPCGTVV
ncbi:hypothetical protein BSLG_004273 [Batrachochytrium salamandrivorans]|nr:hypothetical protein BSLG_004273 [Batrachochytrium salamandrivorans]